MTHGARSRREILALAGACMMRRRAEAADTPADYTLRISEVDHEIAPGRIVRTLAYNGQVPGPALRMKEGRAIAIDVINETRRPEMVHWHGLHIPPEGD